MRFQRLLVAVLALVVAVGVVIVTTQPTPTRANASEDLVTSTSSSSSTSTVTSTTSTIPVQQVLNYYTALEWQAAKVAFDSVPKPAPPPAKPKAVVPPKVKAPAAPKQASSGGSRWDQLAQCETGGNWAHPPVGGYGYSGGTMTLPSTWRAYGGTAFAPAAYQATKAQQIIVNERILADVGWGAWPGCSRKFGWR